MFQIKLIWKNIRRSSIFQFLKNIFGIKITNTKLQVHFDAFDYVVFQKLIGKI